MTTYAIVEEVRSKLARFPDVALPSADDDLESLIRDAERAVDERLGPYSVDETTGRKLDPGELTAVQVEALKQATVVAVGHLAQLDAADIFGADDVLPEQVHPMRGAGLGPRIDEQLAGFDLIARSGAVVTVDADPFA